MLANRSDIDSTFECKGLINSRLFYIAYPSVPVWEAGCSADRHAGFERSYTKIPILTFSYHQYLFNTTQCPAYEYASTQDFEVDHQS